MVAGLKNGADDYVVKPFALPNLLARMESVLRRANYPKVTAGTQDLPDNIDLTEREKEILTLVAKGLTNKEIADRLNISLTTAITHRRNIMDKLNLKSVSALTIYAVTHGYIDIGDI